MRVNTCVFTIQLFFHVFSCHNQYRYQSVQVIAVHNIFLKISNTISGKVGTIFGLK